MQEDYQKQRDPIKEFFKLVSEQRNFCLSFVLTRFACLLRLQTCQSIKINSPHMNLIALINSDMLYERALSEQIPYFKFSSWIESTVQKEVITQLFMSKKGAKSQIPDDLITEDTSKRKTTDPKQQRPSKQNSQSMSHIIAFMREKTKNIKMPKMPTLAMPARSSLKKSTTHSSSMSLGETEQKQNRTPRLEGKGQTETSSTTTPREESKREHPQRPKRGVLTASFTSQGQTQQASSAKKGNISKQSIAPVNSFI